MTRPLLLGARLEVPDGLDLDLGLDLAALSGAVQALERAGFAAVFIGPTGRFEPFTTLAALSTSTERIGLVATTGLEDDPYTIARRTATLDHLSHGRAGWAIVGAGADDPGSSNRAAEFVEVVRALWDSTDDDAVIADKSSGVYLPIGRRHAIDHVGSTFTVAGPLNVSRPPQGHPVLFGIARTADGDPSCGIRADVRVLASSDGPASREREREREDGAVWVQVHAGASPRELADTIEERWRSGTVDGVLLTLGDLPTEADRVVGEVVPILVERGISVLGPGAGRTFRDVLGLPRPSSPRPSSPLRGDDGRDLP